ncbi:hypothetical protein FQR65_LT11129 [Abscondita terminalis]|nr:hypothetical protein FQR65_LT11129 [Abscondita terminalis]
MEESNKFLNQIQNYVRDHNVKGGLELIRQLVEAPNVLSDVLEFLIAEIDQSKNVDCAQQILVAIGKECDPEEVLLELIDIIDRCRNDKIFVILCRILFMILLRLPAKRLNSLGWGLNAIHLYLSKISMSSDGEESLVDADSVIDRISFLFNNLLPIYSALIENFKSEIGEARLIVLKFTLQLLGKPLAFLDLKSENTTSETRRISENIVKQISELCPDIFAILEIDSSYDIGHVDVLALSTLFYLVLSENVAKKKLPIVYSNVYIFQRTLTLATELLNYENQFAQHNGLCLLQAIIERIPEHSLSYLLLDSEYHSHFCKTLTHIIVYSHLEAHRKKGLELYRHYLFLFDTKGRYLLIYNLTYVLIHTSIMGFTVTQYKDMLMIELKKPKLSEFFSGYNLYNVLNRFCYLPNQEKSDILELADQIVAVLNLLRYLIIRDKENVTGICNYFKKLEINYLEPLKKGLGVSRAHYELKIKNLKDESAEGDKGDSEVSVTVGGHKLSGLPTNEKINFLYSALTTFDVIDNLLCRVNELIEM